MLTLGEFTALLANQPAMTDCLQECYNAITLSLSGPVREYGCAHVRAHTALGIWRIRHRTTRQGNIPTLGFDDTLEHLAVRSADEKLLHCGFATSDRVFTIFVAEPTREVIGCIRVMHPSDRGD
jgi:hypothetical protein